MPCIACNSASPGLSLVNPSYLYTCPCSDHLLVVDAPCHHRLKKQEGEGGRGREREGRGEQQTWRSSEALAAAKLEEPGRDRHEGQRKMCKLHEHGKRSPRHHTIHYRGVSRHDNVALVALESSGSVLLECFQGQSAPHPPTTSNPRPATVPGHYDSQLAKTATTAKTPELQQATRYLLQGSSGVRDVRGIPGLVPGLPYLRISSRNQKLPKTSKLKSILYTASGHGASPMDVMTVVLPAKERRVFPLKSKQVEVFLMKYKGNKGSPLKIQRK